MKALILFLFLSSCAPRATVAPAIMQATVSNDRASEVTEALTRAELIIFVAKTALTIWKPF